MIKNCLNCNKETTNPQYCSRSCAAIVTNKLYPKKKCKRICSKCTNFVKSYKHTLCDFHNKEYLETRYDYTQELTLQDYWNRDCLKNLHASSKNSHIRGLAQRTHKHLKCLPCANCGYNKHVELCHIKPIRDFLPTDKIKDVNSPTNIIQLCPNCHWEFDNNLLILDFPDQSKSL